MESVIIKKTTNMYDWLDDIIVRRSNDVLMVLKHYVQPNKHVLTLDGPYEINVNPYNKEYVPMDTLDTMSESEYLHIENVDRGVKDWEVFTKDIRDRCPNVKVIAFAQNYGNDDDFTKSCFDVMIVKSSKRTGGATNFLKEEYLVYMKYTKLKGTNNIRDYYYVFEKNGKVAIFIECDKINFDLIV